MSSASRPSARSSSSNSCAGTCALAASPPSRSWAASPSTSSSSRPRSAATIGAYGSSPAWSGTHSPHRTRDPPARAGRPARGPSASFRCRPRRRAARPRRARRGRLQGVVERCLRVRAADRQRARDPARHMPIIAPVRGTVKRSRRRWGPRASRAVRAAAAARGLPGCGWRRAAGGTGSPRRPPQGGRSDATRGRGRSASAELPYRPAVPANLDTTVLGFVVRMDALTINEAAETTGWSPRMLRYVERVGLVEPAPLGVRLPPLRPGRAAAPAHAARAARRARGRPLRRRLRRAPAQRRRAARRHRGLARGPARASRARPRRRLAALGAGEAPAPARPPRHALTEVA